MIDLSTFFFPPIIWFQLKCTLNFSKKAFILQIRGCEIEESVSVLFSQIFQIMINWLHEQMAHIIEQMAHIIINAHIIIIMNVLFSFFGIYRLIPYFRWVKPHSMCLFTNVWLITRKRIKRAISYERFFLCIPWTSTDKSWFQSNEKKNLHIHDVIMTSEKKMLQKLKM